MARGAGAHLALNGARRFTNVAVYMPRRSLCHRHKFEAVEGLVGLRMHETRRSSYATRIAMPVSAQPSMLFVREGRLPASSPEATTALPRHKPIHRRHRH